MSNQTIDLQELNRRSKNIGKLKLFMLGAGGILAVLLAVLVANGSGGTLSRTVNETSSLIEGAINIEAARVNPRAADQARWEAMGEHFATLAGIRPESAVAADQARWEAMGLYYSTLADAARERGATADQARWEAMGEHFATLAGLRPESAVAADQARWDAIGLYYDELAAIARERGATADQARWEAMGEHYTTLAGLRPESAVAADQARWDAKGEFYRGDSQLTGVELANLIHTARYTGLALQQYQLTGDPDFLPRCISPELKALLTGTGQQQALAEVATCSD